MNLVEIFGDGTISISDLIINLILGTVLSLVLAAYYLRFGQTYSDRTSHARILPILAVTTLLVITVVKSSLALSLGLVGALSIVRFRTPVKEPEELVYLFLAIAIGLGLGANQRIATIIAIPMILVLLLIPISWTKRRAKQNSFMIISMPGISAAREAFDALIDDIKDYATMVDLRRMESKGDVLEATLYVSAKNAGSIADIIDAVRARVSGAEIAFIEQETGFDI
jgi:hypothetical protein